MKHLFLSLLTLMVVTVLAPQAHAIVEARLTYGGLVSNPDFGKLYSGTTSVPSVAPNYGMGFDGLIFIPLSGLGFGVRYENLGAAASSSGLEFKSTANRTSAVFAYRFINTLIHLGPIFTYGLSHSGGMAVSEGATKYDWQAGSVSSYSAGLEAGVGLGLFILGAEVGYQSLKWSKMEDKNSTSTSTPDIDMSGTYTKVFLGFSI